MDIELRATGTPANVEQNLNQQLKTLRGQHQKEGLGDTWPLLNGLRDYLHRRLSELPSEKVVKDPDGTQRTVAVTHDVTVPLKLSFDFKAEEVEEIGGANVGIQPHHAPPIGATPVATATPSGGFADRRGSRTPLIDEAPKG